MSADAERWRRVREILGEALERDPAEQASFVERASGQDESLRREVEELLAADLRAGEFLDTPAALAAAPLLSEEGSAQPPRAVGPYRILKLLGQGGMGVVYLAERADGQFEQRVALKLLRTGLTEGSPASRFLRERQILARLHHPGIARLLGGGITPEGTPYFALEYVEGRPLGHYCEQEALGLAARLTLFLQVCDAVDYLHRNLVVHRDLKPSNILVTAAGEPRLLDFGIAKLLEEGEAGATRTVTRMMTPEYAAPEQIRGEDVTTVTDVFTLGAILYELLSGERPFRHRSGQLETLERAILEEDPPPPSQAQGPGAALPDGGAELRSRRLRGDLDAIVMKALRKEPDRRYPSVEALAGDVRRHLQGLPVGARGDARGYRLGRFLRRHRLAMAASALVLLALTGGLLGTAWQARRAESARQEAERQRERAERRVADVRRLVGSLLFDFHDAIADLPGSATARRLVVSRALEYLDGLAQEAGDDAALQGELATAYDRVGDVSLRSGDPQEAEQSHTRAYQIRRRLAARDPADAGVRLAVALSLRELGDGRYLAGDAAGAVARYREAARAVEALGAERPDDLAVERERAELQGRLCERLPAAGDLPGAVESCRLRTTLVEAALVRAPADAALRTALAVSTARLAEALRLTGRLADAEAARADAERRARDLAPVDAAGDPHLGSWVLRPKAGPRYSPFTRIRVEWLGRALRFSYLDDAGRLIMTFASAGDGRPAGILGPDGVRRGSITIRRLDERHAESWGEGLPYVYERSTVSADGKTWTSEARMKNPLGQEYTDVDVWDKR